MMAGWLPAETPKGVGESQRMVNMKTIQQWSESIMDAGRLPQSATRQEIVEGLDIVAQAIMNGSRTVAHADALLSMRFALMDGADRAAEYSAITASDIGRKGGSAKSAAKAAAVRENGKKGGRPKKFAPKELTPFD
jgi:hypothetical protein